MKNLAVREMLTKQGYENTCVFDNYAYDNSIIGVTADGQAVYDYDKMVKELSEECGWSEEEAIEWIDYNTLGSIGGCNDYPIVARLNEDEVLANVLDESAVCLAFVINKS